MCNVYGLLLKLKNHPTQNLLLRHVRFWTILYFTPRIIIFEVLIYMRWIGWILWIKLIGRIGWIGSIGWIGWIGRILRNGWIEWIRWIGCIEKWANEPSHKLSFWASGKAKLLKSWALGLSEKLNLWTISKAELLDHLKRHSPDKSCYTSTPPFLIYVCINFRPERLKLIYWLIAYSGRWTSLETAQWVSRDTKMLKSSEAVERSCSPRSS